MTKPNWKKGDYILCTGKEKDGQLKIGTHYKVTREPYHSGTGNLMVCVSRQSEGILGYVQPCSFFTEQIKPKKKTMSNFIQGDIVQCVKQHEEVGIKVGSNYEVKWDSHEGNIGIEVRTESGISMWSLPQDLFTLVNAESKYVIHLEDHKQKYMEEVHGHKPKQYPTQVATLKQSDRKFICVTGLSRSGKDTFADFITTRDSVHHFRFGDTMKDIARDTFDGFPDKDDKEAWTSTARKEKAFNGMNIVEVLIQCVDPLRKADPYVFIRKQLVDMHFTSSNSVIIVSGCRTAEGLKVMEDLGATFVRIERHGQEVAAGATMDDVQVNWPVHYVIKNDSDLHELEFKAEWIYDTVRGG